MNSSASGSHPISVAAMLCPLPSVESSTMLKASGVLDSAATTMQSPGTSGGNGGSFGGCGGAGGSGGGEGGGDGDGGSTVNEVFTSDATDDLLSLYLQLELVAMAVRSPLMWAEPLPL